MSLEGNIGQPKAGSTNVERRKYPRFKVNLPIKYCRVDFDALEELIGRALNISEGGLEIHLSESLEAGQRLTLKLFLSGGSEPNTFESLAEIVWADFNAGGQWGNWRYGVRFVEVSPDNINKLKSFIQGLSK